MQTIKFEITGVSPLLMHNERLANPLDPIVKEMKAVTSKRAKSDDDFAELAWIEFRGGLYHDDEIGPYIPAQWIDATIRDSAKMNKRGTDVKRGVMTIDDKIRLNYAGARDVAGMWKAGLYDQRMVKNQANKVLRTRPMFRGWSAAFSVAFDTGIFDDAALTAILENAGRLIGIGDYRPRFGKFTVKVA